MNSDKKTAEPKEGQDREAAYHLMAERIRKRSGEGKLLLQEEVIQDLGVPGEEPAGAFETLIEGTMKRNEDLRTIRGGNGLSRYYSALYISDAYAGLLVRKEGDPLRMIAEIVRENSKIYPRPLRVDTFRAPPFDLTEEEISTCLQRMEKEEEYKDIARTATSEGTPFLYSTLYLDSDHASMLAEWVDVGQYKSP